MTLRNFLYPIYFLIHFPYFNVVTVLHLSFFPLTFRLLYHFSLCIFSLTFSLILCLIPHSQTLGSLDFSCEAMKSLEQGLCMCVRNSTNTMVVLCGSFDVLTATMIDHVRTGRVQFCTAGFSFYWKSTFACPAPKRSLGTQDCICRVACSAVLHSSPEGVVGFFDEKGNEDVEGKETRPRE
jgi:hypothetical protein